MPPGNQNVSQPWNPYTAINHPSNIIPSASVATTTVSELLLSTTANTQPAATCVAMETGPTQVLLEWPVSIICTQAFFITMHM